MDPAFHYKCPAEAHDFCKMAFTISTHQKPALEKRHKENIYDVSYTIFIWRFSGKYSKNG
jgi:hypothetical protein